MIKSNDDLVRKIFNKSAKDVLSTEPDSFKPITWKKLQTDDDSQKLFTSIHVASLEEASIKARLVAATLKKYSPLTNKASHMSLSSESLVIVLCGTSKRKFTEDDWEMARELTGVISSEE